MNPELYERYLAKKAAKMGITVDELKSQGDSNTSNAPSANVQSNSVLEQPIQQKTIEIPQVKTVQDAGQKRKFALIGYPLGHSISPAIHKAGFESLGLNANYEVLETPPDTLVERIKYLKHNDYDGFNVTIPLKLPISLFVNEIDAYADLARAINTVTITSDKFLQAHNTDVAGFRRAIPSDIILKNKKVAILGTGGAAHAAVVALAEAGMSDISMFTRNIPNAIETVGYFRRKFPNTAFEVYQIESIRDLSAYDMVVNATPIGMQGYCADMMPLEGSVLRTLSKNTIVYDVIYNPRKTILLKESEKLGLRTINGLDMLIYQAICAQEIWFNQTPDFDKMKIAALESL